MAEQYVRMSLWVKRSHRASLRQEVKEGKKNGGPYSSSAIVRDELDTRYKK